MNTINENHRLGRLEHEVAESGFSIYYADVEKSTEPMITAPSLISCYPNPFNPSTTLRYQLSMETVVSIFVYNIQGQVIESLYQGLRPQGQHELTWNADTWDSGLYFIVLRTRDFESTQKVLLLK